MCRCASVRSGMYVVGDLYFLVTKRRCVVYFFVCMAKIRGIFHRKIRYPRARKAGLRERESRETKKSER